MSGDGDNFAAFRKFQKKFVDTNSELFGYLGNQEPAQQQQKGGNVTTTTKRTSRTTVYEQDASGNITTRVYDGDELPPGFGRGPIKTTMKTRYLNMGNQQEFGNNDWFNDSPRPQQLSSFQPVMTNKAFRKSGEKPNMDMFRAGMLQTHNNYRAKHAVGPLKLSNVLNQTAQKWAEHLAELNYMDHSSDNNFGENIYSASSSDPNHYPTAQNVCDSWYKEINDYVFGRDPGSSPPEVSHFTQMVWRLSTELGVGMAKAKDGAVYVVANYNPAGNVNGQFASNVFPHGGQKGQSADSVQRGPRFHPNPHDMLVPPGNRGHPRKAQGPPAFQGGISRKAGHEDPRIFQFRQRMLNAHNTLRAKHGVKLLVLSDRLNKFAQEWAEVMANRDELEHRDPNNYGENIASCWSSDGMFPNAEETAQEFYDEIKEYTFGTDPDGTATVGHFTQLVWAATKELGVGVAQSHTGNWYTVCNYNPAGNVTGQYRNNVFRPMLQSKPQTAIAKPAIPVPPSPPPPPPPPPPSSSTAKPTAVVKPSTIQTSQSKLEEFRKQILAEHNICRSQHGAMPLVLCDKINECAQNWAEHLAKHDEMEHNSESSYGENISTYLSSDLNYYPSAKQVCKDFYEEIEDYKFGADPTGGVFVENFTQMVWCATTQLGVGVAKAGSGSWFVVVNYNPRGNYAGEFKRNVLPKASSAINNSAPVQPPTTAQTDKPAPVDKPDPKLERFIKLALNQHNIYRKKHDVPFLKISADLNKSAQEWAEKCAEEGEIATHDDVVSYGESIFNISSYEANFYPDAEEICRDFYNEVSDYKYAADPGYANVLDFTQMVWKSTTEMGVGIAKSENEDYFVVFHYSPRGNVEGQYRLNVFRPNTGFIPPAILPTEPPKVEVIEQPKEEELDAAAEYKKNVEQFRNMVLSIHNMYRMRHGAPELKITEELHIYAQESAEILAEEDHCHHRPACKYGENCSRYASDDPEYFPSAETVCYDYYKEINIYRWSGTPSIKEKVFHFTQLVWCDSVQIGIGFAKSKTDKYYIVINYNPRGNISGAFEDNVYPLGTKKRPPKRMEFVPPTITHSVQLPKGTIDLKKFRKLLRNQHNIYRKHHGANFIKVSDILNSIAQEWAEKCAKDGTVDYQQGKYGENIYDEIRSDSTWWPTAEEVGKHFYDGYKKYTFGPTPDPGTEQFTQMIWNSCVEIGIGVGKADTGRVFVVVIYSPRGNVAGEYAKNVLRVVGRNQPFVPMRIIAK